ncbi:MAG TPA: ATP-binding protein, partial [Clostridiaceae bacterium]|nr:ATP-binding protein [Clostridiaceae bacterium]
EEHLHIQGDREKMTLALRNILKNAFTYTDVPGTVTVVLKNTGKIQGSDRIILEVTNSPAFIDEQDLDNIWVQFYKRDRSRHRVPNSTGLGLSIVKNILDRHGFPYSLRNVTLPSGETGVSFRVEFCDLRGRTGIQEK